MKGATPGPRQHRVRGEPQVQHPRTQQPADQFWNCTFFREIGALMAAKNMTIADARLGGAARPKGHPQTTKLYAGVLTGCRVAV